MTLDATRTAILHAVRLGSFHPEPGTRLRVATACRTDAVAVGSGLNERVSPSTAGRKKPPSARTVRAKYRRIVGIPDQTGQEKLFGDSAVDASSRSTRPSLAAATEPGKTFFQTDNAP